MNEGYKIPSVLAETEEDRQYYESISQLTLSLAIFLIIYFVTYVYVRRWLIDVRREYHRAYISFLLCVFVAAIMIMWIVVTVLVIGASYDVQHSHWILRWLSVEYASRLWVHLAWISSTTACMVAPFAYMYFEAEGFRSNNTCSRLLETVIVQSLLVVVVLGIFLLTWSLWSGDLMLDPWSTNVLSNMGLFIPGLLTSLWSAHRGFSELIARSAAMRVPLGYRRELYETVETLDLRLQHLHTLIDSRDRCLHRVSYVGAPILSASSSRSLYDYRPLDRNPVQLCTVRVREQILKVSNERDAILNQYSASQKCIGHPIIRNSACVFTVFTTLMMTWHIIVRALSHEVYLMADVLTSPDSFLRVIVRSVSAVHLVDTQDSHFVWSWTVSALRLLAEFGLGANAHWPKAMRAVADMVLVLYFLLGVYVGVTTSIRRRRANWGATSESTMSSAQTQVLLVKFTVGLVVTAALPLAAWTIGLAHFNISRMYPPASIMDDSVLVHVLNIGFLSLMLWRLLDFWWKYVVFYYARTRVIISNAMEGRACRKLFDVWWQSISVLEHVVNAPKRCVAFVWRIIHRVADAIR